MREKLIELLTEYYGVDPAYYGIEAQHLADHLIANGVRIVANATTPKNAPCAFWYTVNSTTLHTTTDIVTVEKGKTDEAS